MKTKAVGLFSLFKHKISVIEDLSSLKSSTSNNIVLQLKRPLYYVSGNILG